MAKLRSLLELAAAGEEPLEQLLAAWVLVPAAEIAEAIERAPLEEDVAHVVADGAALGPARLSELDHRRDPRMSAVLVGWCADPPWHATSAMTFYTHVLAFLENIADPRAIAQLELAEKGAARTVRGRTMRTWLVAKIGAARAALTAVYPMGPPALAAADRALVARAAAAIAAGVPSAPRTSRDKRAADDLLAAIRADPSDDGARLVYADLLVERGDPRGELITMQLLRRGAAPTLAQEKAELGLLAKHARAWLGELAAVTGGGRREDLAVGPERSGHGTIRFERGFLAECTLSGTAPRIARVVGSPQLATVEVLIVDEPCAALVRDTPLPAVTVLGIVAEDVAALVAAPLGQRVTTLAISGSGATEELMEAVTAIRSLRALRSLVLDLREGSVEPLAFVAIDLATSVTQLQRIAVTTLGAPQGTFTRAGNRWVGVDPQSKELLARVRG